MVRVRVWLLPVLLVLGAEPALADRPFPWTWTSATRAPGSAEAQLWTTVRSGRLTPWDSLELRAWLSAGVLRQVDVQAGLETDVVLQRREQKAFDGRVSVLARYRLLEPTDVIGLALIARAGVGVASTVLEGRLVLDRALGDVLLAANSSFERTIFWDRREAIDTRFEHSLAVRLQVTTDVSVGFEGRARHALQAGQYQGTAFSVGPTVSVSTKWLWVSVGAVAQIAADKADGDKGNGQAIIFRDDERFGVRVVLAAPVSTEPSGAR